MSECTFQPITTPDAGQHAELASRLIAHAELHDAHTPHDDEQLQWAADLREAARIVGAAPADEAKLTKPAMVARQILKRIAKQLRAAGATIPIQNDGTIESAHRGGLSVALILIEQELEAIAQRGEVEP